MYINVSPGVQLPEQLNVPLSADEPITVSLMMVGVGRCTGFQSQTLLS